MKRILALLLVAAVSVFAPRTARADSTVVSLPPATTLIGSSTYLNQAGSGNNQLLFNPTLFGLSGGALTPLPGALTSTYLSSSVSPGSCTNCNLTYDQAGRITAAASGGGGGGSGTVTSISTSGPLTGGPITTTGTLGLTGPSNLTTFTTGAVPIGNGASPFSPVGPTAQTLFGWSTGGAASTITLGSNLSMTGATLNASGGGTAGGSNTQAQYNSSGAFGGSSGLSLSATKITAASVGLGSDATGDIYYNGGGGTLTRLGIGSVGQVLTVASGLPSWAASAGGTSFSALTSGTNTTMAGVVGSGASLGVSGSGTVTATNVPAGLGTGSVCSAAGVLSAPSSCPITLVTQSGSPFALVAANAGGLVRATSGSPTTVTLAQSTGALGAGFGVDLFTQPSTSTLNVTTSTLNGQSSLKLGAYQDLAIAADGAGNYVGAASVPWPATQTGTTFLRDDMTWTTPAGAGTVTSVTCGTGLTGGTITTTGTCALATALPNGTTATTQTLGDNTTKVATDAFVIANAASGTSFTLSPGLASAPGTYNSGAQTIGNGSTLSSQVFYESHATSYTLAATDNGKIPVFTASGQTATFPNPGSIGSGGFQFGYDGTHAYAITTVGGAASIYGCGAAGTTITGLTYTIQLVPDGTNYLCLPNGVGTTTTQHSSSNLTLAASDQYVVTVAPWTTAATWTFLPSTNYPDGRIVRFADDAQVVTNTNTLTVAPGAGDTVNLTTGISTNFAGGRIVCQLDKTSKNWTCYGSVPNGTAGQLLVGQSSTVPFAPVTPSGDWSVNNLGVTVNAKVNGVAYPASPSANQVCVTTSGVACTYGTADAALSANVPLKNGNNTYTGVNTFSGIAQTQRVVAHGTSITVNTSTDGSIIIAGGSGTTPITYTCPAYPFMFLIADGDGLDASTGAITISPASGQLNLTSGITLNTSGALPPAFDRVVIHCDGTSVDTNSWIN